MEIGGYPEWGAASVSQYVCDYLPMGSLVPFKAKQNPSTWSQAAIET